MLVVLLNYVWPQHLVSATLLICFFAEISAAAVAARTPADMDECNSVSTTLSSINSTENNSHVYDNDNGLAVDAHLWEIRESFHQINLSGDGQMICLRAYQEEVLHWAREGNNVAIFLPTGTGKTFIVLKYVQVSYAEEWG